MIPRISRVSSRLALLRLAARKISSTPLSSRLSSPSNRLILSALATAGVAGLVFSSLSNQEKSVAASSSPLTTYKLSIMQPERSGPLPSFDAAAKLELSDLDKFYSFNPDAALDVPLYLTSPNKTRSHLEMELMVRRAQDRISQSIVELEVLEARSKGLEPVPIREDLTIGPNVGGVTRVIQGGRVFSKGACNTTITNIDVDLQKIRFLSVDHEELRKFFEENDKTKEIPLDAKVRKFTASISIILHPVSPNVPTVHANYRFFEYALPNGRIISSWVAGGSDLTPAFINVEDGKYFHSRLKADCDKFDTGFYTKFKDWADKYFYLSHRQERRGIGGIFFDDLNDRTKQQFYFNFLKQLSTNFSATYFPIVLKRNREKYTESDMEWKRFRAGRYVEFNLIHDKGTSYGLKMPNARADAILVSLPLEPRFEYGKEIPVGSREEFATNIFKNPIKWV